jgi:alpha-ribazole phosphatase
LKATKTIYLVRHGRIQAADGQRRYIGQMDVPLNDEGIKQARYLQERFAGIELGAVYCSDLYRSRQTAEIIVADRIISLVVCKNLREIDVGEWEGCTFTDIAQRFPAHFKARGSDIAYYPIPGGESFVACSKRVIALFHEILKTSVRNILIVGHAGTNRLLLCHALGLPVSNLFRIGQDYGCLNLIWYGNEGYQVKLMNDCSGWVQVKAGG